MVIAPPQRMEWNLGKQNSCKESLVQVLAFYLFTFHPQPKGYFINRSQVGLATYAPRHVLTNSRRILNAVDAGKSLRSRTD